jgi:hypothetical protein
MRDNTFNNALQKFFLIIFSWINILFAIVMLVLAITDLINNGNSYGYHLLIYIALTLTTKVLRMRIV